MQHAFRTTELAPDERVALERLLGRRLENDEAIELIAHKVTELPADRQGECRRKAAARILELAKGRGLGGATVRELIDEGRRF